MAIKHSQMIFERQQCRCMLNSPAFCIICRTIKICSLVPFPIRKPTCSGAICVDKKLFKSSLRICSRILLQCDIRPIRRFLPYFLVERFLCKRIKRECAHSVRQVPDFHILLQTAWKISTPLSPHFLTISIGILSPPTAFPVLKCLIA